MCGIAGIWHRDGRPVPRSALLAMTTAIAHRGPDGSGLHLAGSLGLGHRRLKVIDLSDGASQPIWLPDRALYMVYNGEVHNYLELAGQLRASGVRLQQVRDVLLDPRTSARGWLDQRWLARRLGGNEDRARHWVRRNLSQVWTLFTLELWGRMFLDNDVSLQPGRFVTIVDSPAAPHDLTVGVD